MYLPIEVCRCGEEDCKSNATKNNENPEEPMGKHLHHHCHKDCPSHSHCHSWRHLYHDNLFHLSPFANVGYSMNGSCFRVILIMMMRRVESI